MDVNEIRKELVCIKQRLTAIETDIGWFKTLCKLTLIGIASLIGIEVTPILTGV